MSNVKVLDIPNAVKPQEALVLRHEKRWWVCVVTPSGTLARLMTSYPDKASAVRAIATLGYKRITTMPGDVTSALVTSHD